MADTPTPYILCEQYHNETLDRHQLINRLASYPYVKSDNTDGYDQLSVDRAGAWAEVSRALRQGLITDDIYEEVFTQRHSRQEMAGQHEP